MKLLIFYFTCSVHINKVYFIYQLPKQKPIILATTVLGMATCVACIGPILEEKERIYQEMLVYGAVCTTVSATIAYQAAVDRKEKIAMMDEEEKQRKLEDEAKQKDEEEKERLRHLEEEQQRDKQAAEQALREQLVAEATAAAEEAAKLKNERMYLLFFPPQKFANRKQYFKLISCPPLLYLTNPKLFDSIRMGPQ